LRAFHKADCRQLVESRAILEPAIEFMRLIAAQFVADHVPVTLSSRATVITL
jgi:hypothetical protein